MKKLDLNKTVYELTEEYPELIDIIEIRPLWTIVQSLLATSLLGSDF